MQSLNFMLSYNFWYIMTVVGTAAKWKYMAQKYFASIKSTCAN